MPTDRARLTVIVPVYNEEETVPELLRRLRGAVDRLGFAENEVLLISDGSTDGTDAQLLAAADELFRPVFLSRNFGHQAAVSTGLELSTGTVVAIIDGDLQDPPEVIAELVAALERGADVAFAIRAQRKEHLLKRACYSAFYRGLDWVADIKIPLDTGDFCCFTGEVRDAILRLPERNRFVRGIRAWVGFVQVGVPYEREARFAGAPKYTFRKLVQLAFDGVFSFSKLPVKLMQFLGFCVSTLAFCVGAAYLVWYFLDRSVFPSGFATLAISIWFLGGVNLLFLGIVGEYVVRTCDEARGRPIAIVRKSPPPLGGSAPPPARDRNPERP
jgi:polyisoprenyl-phosphate glycosyltransferase